MTPANRHDANDGSSLNAKAVGARIRARRNDLGLTLQNVADRTHLSKSFLSQVEIGKSWPSVGALERIGAVLNVPTRAFVSDGGDYPTALAQDASHNSSADDHEQPLDRRIRITRKGERKAVAYPGARNPLELLTPDLQRRFEVTMASDHPDGWHDIDRAGVEHEEFALVLEGRYEIQVADEIHTVGAGDSIYLSPVRSYRFRAVGDTPTQAIWIAIPPAF